MIILERIRTVKAINAKFRGADKREKDKELMLAQRALLTDPNKKIEFKSSFWKTAKAQLKRESNGKCAYCEANTEVVAHGDVEHYRPKSVYWWLAYTYDNFLYACQICNQIYKSDNFPIDANQLVAPSILNNTSNQEIEQLAGHISPDPIDINLNFTLQHYLEAHRSEKAFLLNPYFDDPSIYFAYEVDDIIEEVKIIPTAIQYLSYVKAAEDFYGINRIELKNARYQIFQIFRVFKKMSHKLSIEKTDEFLRKDIKKQLDSMLSDKYLFAGMNRYFDQIF